MATTKLAPVHPGEILLEEFLGPMGITQYRLANPAQWQRMRHSTDCMVCRSRPDALTELETSWVLVGPDDPVRGYACLVFGRHAIELRDLTNTEGSAFMRGFSVSSSPWVVALMHAPQVVPVHVGVDLGGGQVRVTQHLLHRSQVRTTLQEMSGERVTQRVRRYPLLD